MVRSIWNFRLPMALFGAALAVSSLAAGPAAADDRLEVRDFVLTLGIVGREPTNDTNGFTIHDEQAYAFARIKNTGSPTAVNVVWQHEGTQHGSVWLNVGVSPAWRTWSSTNLKPGNWSVSLVDTDGSVLVQRSFTVGQTADAMAATGDVGEVGGVSEEGDLMVEEPISTATAGEFDGPMYYPM